jgi:hypothetical protein
VVAKGWMTHCSTSAYDEVWMISDSKFAVRVLYSASAVPRLEYIRFKGMNKK